MADMALATWRKARCVELALDGRSYDEIAREVGYANRGTAHRTVTKALRERVYEAVDELREVELARLDSLQVGLWDRAMAGDTKATEAVLKIIDRRIRLLGLDQPAPEVERPMTVVVQGDREEYISTLKMIAGEA